MTGFSNRADNKSEEVVGAQAVNNSVPDNCIGKPVFAVNLQALPTDNCCERVSEVQECLSGICSDGANMTPVQSLHISVFPIIGVRGDCTVDREKMWSEVSLSYMEKLGSLVEKVASFRLNNPWVEVHQSAIIMRFDPSPGLERLRDDIANLPLFQGFGQLRPTITHATLLRFDREVDLNGIIERVDQARIHDLEWPVDQLVLQREKVYPSLSSDALMTYRLSEN